MQTSLSGPLQKASLLVAAFCAALVLHAQTADELIAKNIEAKGGMAQLKAITTLRSSGRIDTQGLKIAAEMEQKPDFLVRMSFTVQGMTQTQAWDGSEGWQNNPFAGRRDPERLGDDDARDLVESSDFYGPLVDY